MEKLYLMMSHIEIENRIEKPLLSLYSYNEILSASPVGVTRDNI